MESEGKRERERERETGENQFACKMIFPGLQSCEDWRIGNLDQTL